MRDAIARELNGFTMMAAGGRRSTISLQGSGRRIGEGRKARSKRRSARRSVTPSWSRRGARPTRSRARFRTPSAASKTRSKRNRRRAAAYFDQGLGKVIQQVGPVRLIALAFRRRASGEPEICLSSVVLSGGKRPRELMGLLVRPCLP